VGWFWCPTGAVTVLKEQLGKQNDPPEET